MSQLIVKRQRKLNRHRLLKRVVKAKEEESHLIKMKVHHQQNNMVLFFVKRTLETVVSEFLPISNAIRILHD